MRVYDFHDRWRVGAARLAAQIEQAEQAPESDSEPLDQVQAVVEIVDGRNYLLQHTQRNLIAQEAQAMLDKLKERFPNSRFAIVPPDISVVEAQDKLRDDLASALRLAADSLDLTRHPVDVECTARKPGETDTVGRVCHRPQHTEGAHLDGGGWWL